nr:MAG TPA: hypothetical protein [Caudoviricetes sp.]
MNQSNNALILPLSSMSKGSVYLTNRVSPGPTTNGPQYVFKSSFYQWLYQPNARCTGHCDGNTAITTKQETRPVLVKLEKLTLPVLRRAFFPEAICQLTIWH